MIKQILMMLFPSWETIYFTSSTEKYAVIKGKLVDNGIKTKTRIISHNSSGRGHSWIPIPNSYEILVGKEDVHKASEIIHSTR